MVSDPVMDDRVRETLGELVRTRGLGTMVDDPSRCRAFLRDLCPDRPAEISVLVAAVEERIPQALASAPAPGLRVESSIEALVAARGISPYAARWAVRSWLDVVASGTDPLPPHDPEPDGGGRSWRSRPPVLAAIGGGLLLVGLALWSWAGTGDGPEVEPDRTAAGDTEDVEEQDAVDAGEGSPRGDDVDLEDEVAEDEVAEDEVAEDDVVQAEPEEQDETDDSETTWPALVETFPAAAGENCADTTDSFDGDALQRIGCDVDDGVLADYLDWRSTSDMEEHLEDAKATYVLAHESEWNDAAGTTRGTLVVFAVAGGHQIEWTVESTIQSARIFVPEAIAPTADAALDHWVASPVTFTTP